MRHAACDECWALRIPYGMQRRGVRYTGVYSGYLTGMICTMYRYCCTAAQLYGTGMCIYLVLAGCGTVCKINGEWVRTVQRLFTYRYRYSSMHYALLLLLFGGTAVYLELIRIYVRVYEYVYLVLAQMTGRGTGCHPTSSTRTGFCFPCTIPVSYSLNAECTAVQSRLLVVLRVFCLFG